MGATRKDGGPELDATIPGVDTGLRKHSVVIGGHATSVTIEDVFWRGIKRIAEARRVSINALLTEIDQDRAGNLSSAIRVFVFEKLTGERSLRA